MSETSISPVIVTGTQRSGTTLLHHILDCSTDVWSRNEMYAVHSLVFDKHCKDRRRQLIRQLEDFLNIDLSAESFPDSKQGRVDLLSRVMEMVARSHGKQRWCLKDPRATYYLKDYAEAMPNAMFVVTIRDPRAVCRSYMSPRGFVVGRPANWIAGAERWQREVDSQLRFRDEYPERVLVLRYEEIVSGLADQIKCLCEFLGIPNEPAMLNYYSQNSSIAIHDGNENILRPPDPSKIDAWRDSMTPSQTAAVESVACQTMELLGYTAIHPHKPVNQLRSLASRFHDRFVREYRWQRHKYAQRRSAT